MAIIAHADQLRFVKEHIPHRVGIMLAPFERSPDLPWTIHEAVLHGSFVAFRSLMGFIGLKDERKSPAPVLIPHIAKSEDVSLASFGLPLVAIADLSRSDATLLASVYRVTNKAVAHLTADSGHPVIDIAQYQAACSVLRALLKKHLLSRY